MKLELESLNLPQVSEAGMRILDVLAKDDYSINDIAMVVAEDPTLSAMMLKYANSPLYRRYQEITSVRSAINLLGVKNVKLVVTLAAMRSFSHVSSIVIDKLWEHAFSISLICKLIAKNIDRKLAEDMEFTGIIHDICSMTLVANYPKECDVLLKESNDELGYDQLENDAFECPRGELVSWVAENLHLPSVAVDAIKLLFSVEVAEPVEGALRQSQILALAHVVDLKLHEDDLLTIRQHLDTDLVALLASLAISESQLEDIIEESKEKLSERFMF